MPPTPHPLTLSGTGLSEPTPSSSCAVPTSVASGKISENPCGFADSLCSKICRPSLLACCTLFFAACVSAPFRATCHLGLDNHQNHRRVLMIACAPTLRIIPRLADRKSSQIMRRLSLGELVKYIATWDRTIPTSGIMSPAPTPANGLAYRNFLLHGGRQRR